ncbi:unnamed protein product [Cylicostephanus goldi]|uniref:C-type lectin domain-containing protein n=1 Tax=Cylicostephanus goldi TaxID=71465 RepID=A0A3P6SDY0_CYLGO|nr:unnamed protein product [Cylicostephanus goldi]
MTTEAPRSPCCCGMSAQAAPEMIQTSPEPIQAAPVRGPCCCGQTQDAPITEAPTTISPCQMKKIAAPVVAPMPVQPAPRTIQTAPRPIQTAPKRIPARKPVPYVPRPVQPQPQTRRARIAPRPMGQPRHQAAAPSAQCPAGWKQYGSSCYYVEMEKMDYQTAERRCMEKGATMFGADSIMEYVSLGYVSLPYSYCILIVLSNFLQEEVMYITPLFYWSWIGVVRQHDNMPIQFANGALDTSSINWLFKTGPPTQNGWSPTFNCAAHYNSGTTSTNYVYFYPCNYAYHSICKKRLY